MLRLSGAHASYAIAAGAKTDEAVVNTAKKVTALSALVIINNFS